MLYMKCPDCKNEYSVNPVRFKPGSFVCQACGWHGDGFSPWGTLFDANRWLESRQELTRILRNRVFLSMGFPIDLLMGDAAARDGVLMFRADTPGGPRIVEHLFTSNKKWCPDWLDCDSSGNPRSRMRFFWAWIHNDGRDTAYVCDSPLAAFRIMEAWWAAEGRMPDIMWLSMHGTNANSRPWRTTRIESLDNRHILCVGGEPFINKVRMRGIRVHAALVTKRGFMPENIYETCRKLEDIANDPGNNSDTCELAVDGVGRRVHRPGIADLGLGRCTGWKKLREVQEKCLPAGGLPKIISHTPRYQRECPGLHPRDRKECL